MTLDGKIASRTGDSRWISNPASRKLVHALRGRVDAILVGAGTALADDPRLTVRPPGPRTPVRIVVDRHAQLACDSQLARTANETPVRVFVGPHADADRCNQLAQTGVDIVRCQQEEHAPMVLEVLQHCGQSGMTNVLVEGGGTLLGALHDGHLIDEIHAYIAPKLVGGRDAITPVAGHGLAAIHDSATWTVQSTQQVEDDFLIIARKTADSRAK